MRKLITFGISIGLVALALLTPALWVTYPDQKSYQPVTNREQVVAAEDMLVPIQADTLAAYLTSIYGRRYQSLQIEPGNEEWLLSWNRSAQILMNQMGDGFSLEREAFVDAGFLADKGEKTVLRLPVVEEEGVHFVSIPVMCLNEILRKGLGQ